MKDFVIRKLNQTSSTNAVLKEMAKQGSAEDGFVVISEVQSEGHGQYGRVFESPLGGLYMSVYIVKSLKDDVSDLTQKVGRMVQSVIEEDCGIRTSIKLPNDILFEGKKLCGILTESFSRDGMLHIIIGIGLNLNTETKSFSEELQKDAASLCEITGQIYDTDKIARSILDKIREV